MILVENMDTIDSYLQYNVVKVDLARLIHNVTYEWELYEEFAGWTMHYSPSPRILDNNILQYSVDVILSPGDRPEDWYTSADWTNPHIGILRSTSKHTSAWTWNDTTRTLSIRGSRTVVNDVLANLFFTQDPSWHAYEIGGFYTTFRVWDSLTRAIHAEVHELITLVDFSGIFSVQREDKGSHLAKLPVVSAKTNPTGQCVKPKTDKRTKRTAVRFKTATFPRFISWPKASKPCNVKIRAQKRPSKMRFEQLRIVIPTPNDKIMRTQLVRTDEIKRKVLTQSELKGAWAGHQPERVIPWTSRYSFYGLKRAIPTGLLPPSGPTVIKTAQKVCNLDLAVIGARYYAIPNVHSMDFITLINKNITSTSRSFLSTDWSKVFKAYSGQFRVQQGGLARLPAEYSTHAVLSTYIDGTKQGTSLTQFYKCKGPIAAPTFTKTLHNHVINAPVRKYHHFLPIVHRIAIGGLEKIALFAHPLSLALNPRKVNASGNGKCIALINPTFVGRVCNGTLQTPDGGRPDFGRISGGVSHVRALKFTGRING